MIRQVLEALISGRSLEMDQASMLMTEIMDGRVTPAQLASILTALRLKGETPEEIAGMAKVMREKGLEGRGGWCRCGYLWHRRLRSQHV